MRHARLDVREGGFCAILIQTVRNSLILKRRDGGVVDRARLESVCRGNSTVGSNPTLSANSLALLGRCRFESSSGFDRLAALVALGTNPTLSASSLDLQNQHQIPRV